VFSETDNTVTIWLSPGEKLVFWIFFGLCLIATFAFAASYVWPGSIFPKVDKPVDITAHLVAAIGTALGLLYVLYVSYSEAWFRCRFVVDGAGIQKIYPTGRVVSIQWVEVRRAHYWTEVIEAHDGRRIYFGYFGAFGFDRATYKAIYKLPGEKSVFVKQFSGKG
jgi:hypothetical protein